jgi:hypothetical protein
VAAALWHLEGLPYMNTLRLGFRAHRASYCLANALDGHPDPFGSPLELAQPSLAVFGGAFVLLAEAVHLELEDPPAVIRPRWFRQLVEARLVFVGEVAVVVTVHTRRRVPIPRIGDGSDASRSLAWRPSTPHTGGLALPGLVARGCRASLQRCPTRRAQEEHTRDDRSEARYISPDARAGQRRRPIRAASSPDENGVSSEGDEVGPAAVRYVGA